MGPTEFELTQLWFLVEDWIDQDPFLKEHFSMWPVIPKEERQWEGGQHSTRWVLRKSRNICYLTRKEIRIMDPIVDVDEQPNSQWVKLDCANPKFFDILRSYLLKFI